MSNYQKENLLNIAPEKVPAGTLAVKIGGDVFTAGNVKIIGTDVSAIDFYKCTAVALPEPIFAEKFNGTLTNNFTQLASAPEYSTIDGRLAMKCDYDHRLLAPCDGFPSGNAPRTMSAWIYCNSGSLSGTWNMFCIYGSDDGFGMRAYSGELYADGTAWQPYETIGNLTENAWQHIVLVGEGNKTVGYINGVKSGEVTYELETVLTGGLQIGYQYGSESSYSTDAYISDLQIYDVALSAEQVEELYKPSTGFPEPVFAEKFNGALTNDFTQLGEAPVFETIDGRQCMKCDYDHRLSHSAEALPSGNSPRTMSAWVYCNEGSLSSEWSLFCCYGNNTKLRAYYEELVVPGVYPYEYYGTLSEKTWTHLTVTFEGEKVIGYIDGQQTAQFNTTFDASYFPLGIGYETEDDRPFSTDAYISDLQIYDTALTAEQVKELYEGIEDTPSLPANTWNGYKAILVPDGEGSTYYAFEETLTEGLIYGKGFTPVVDKVYDSQAMIEANLFQKLIPLMSSPENMTDFENDEWIVSAGPTTDDMVAWKAFSEGRFCVLFKTADNWIQWQNKKRKVLVKQFSANIYFYNVYGSAKLQGSNDGYMWNTIAELPQKNDIILNIPDNKTSYYYHRIFIEGIEAEKFVRVSNVVAKSVIE